LKKSIKKLFILFYNFLIAKKLWNHINSLKIIAWFISKKVLLNGRKFLFIDCGSNLGQGFNFFKKYFKTDIFDYILIEPNPNCLEQLKKITNDKILLIGKGVWKSKTILKFYGISETKNKTTLGGSLIDNHNSLWYKSNKNEATEIETISLSELILEKKDKYDTIVIKMDIESSEYEVLRSLLTNNSIEYIKHIFVEFHSQYFSHNEQNKYLKLENELVDEIRSRNVGLTKWI